MQERRHSRRLAFFRAFRLPAVAFVLLVLHSGSAPLLAAPPLKKATLIPLWSPQAQFAGYYVALEKGIYLRHGVDMEILAGGAGNSPVEALQSGRADYAVMWLTTALRHRDAGVRLVNLAQVIRKSSVMLVSMKSGGIASLEGMRGRKVGLWPGDLSIPPVTLFSRRGIHVKPVPLTHTVNLFLRGGIEVTSAMWYNEFHTILNAGVDRSELNVLFLCDEGVNFPEDGIYTLEGTLRKDPELASAIADASLEGWRYAFEHPDEALDIVMAYMLRAHVPANRMHQQWMLSRMRDVIIPDGTAGSLPSGTLDSEDYRAAGEAMLGGRLIKAYPLYSDFVWREADVR